MGMLTSWPNGWVFVRLLMRHWRGFGVAFSLPFG